MADRDQEYYKIRNIWYGMIHRCTNPKNTSFHGYGGRGITICDRWHSFELFHKDMRDTYIIGLSIGRIDNNGPYSSENCRWETKKEQANNRTTSRCFTIDGITKTLEQWIESYGCKSSTVRQRFYGYGWSIEESLTGKKEA